MEIFRPVIKDSKTPQTEKKDIVGPGEKLEEYENISINTTSSKEFEEKESRKLINQENINNTREKINKSMEKRKGYSFSFKPENIWNEKDEEYAKDPISKISNLFKRFYNKEIEKRKVQKSNENNFIEDNKKYQKISFDYKPGDGVLGMTGNKIGILANNFRNCSALVFQGEKNISVIHISPEASNHYSDYVIKDTNLYGHISSALREMINDNLSSKKTSSESELSQIEIQKLQELFDSGRIKTSMIHGEAKASLELPISFATTANLKKLPFFKTDDYYVGSKSLGTEFSIYANTENIYVIGENNKIMKKDVDFPPTMIDFKKEY